MPTKRKPGVGVNPAIKVQGLLLLDQLHPRKPLEGRLKIVKARDPVNVKLSLQSTPPSLPQENLYGNRVTLV